MNLRYAVFAVCLACGAAPGGDANRPATRESLEPKLAAGCDTKDECGALYADAVTRRNECVLARNIGSCKTEIDQLNRAEVLKKEQYKREANERRMADLRERADAREEGKRQKADEEAAAARQAKASAMARELAGVLRSNLLTNVRERENPRDVLADLQRVHERITEINELVPGMADGMKAAIAEVDAATVALVEQEEKCRATPACMDRRKAEPICVALQDKKRLSTELAREKSNPAGVVDMRKLHGIGWNLQETDSDLKRLRAEFQKERNKAFSESLCVKPHAGQ